MKAEFLRHQYFEIYVRNTTSRISAMLKKIVTTYHRDISKDQKNDIIKSLLIELETESERLSFRPDFGYPLKAGGDIERYLTNSISTLASNAYRDFGLTPAFVSSIDGFLEKYNETLNKLINAFFALDELGVNNLPPDIGNYAYIQISLPAYQSEIDLEQAGRELSEQARIIKLFSDCIGESRVDFPLFAISSSRISAYIKANYHYATHFSALVFFILGTANSYLEMRIKAAELERALGAPQEQIVLNAVADQIAAKCADVIGQKFTAPEAHFEAEKCAAAAKRIFESIERGFRYDIHVPDDHGNRVEAETDGQQSANGIELREKRDRLRSLSEQIRLRFDALPSSDATFLLTQSEDNK